MYNNIKNLTLFTQKKHVFTLSTMNEVVQKAQRYNTQVWRR